ncbi:MAG: putative signal transducing protein [Verrucomicrobiales bacterium]
MEMVTIFTTFNPAEAQMLLSRLKAAGFDAEIADELSALNYNIASGGAKVQVPSDRAVEARALLDSGDSEAGDESIK